MKTILSFVVLIFLLQPNISEGAEEGYTLIYGDKIIVKNRRIENAAKLFNTTPNATYVHLYRNKLKEIPEEIGILQNLEVLIIGGNPLVELPEAIGTLKKLRKLSIRRNNLTSIPESIGDLENLEELYVSFNELTELPVSLENLPRLEFLDISNNRIEVFPKEYCKISSLRFLTIGRNNLKELPEEIYLLQQLVELDVVGSGNLVRIPGSMKEISTLERIYVDSSIIVPYTYFNLNPRLKIIVQSRNSVLK